MVRFLLLFLVLFSSVANASPFAAEAAIYQVFVSHGNGRGSTGTGVLVSRDKVLTNCHVLDGAQGTIVMRHRNSSAEFRSNRFQRLGKLDACLIIGQFDGTPVRVSASVTPSQSIWIFGYPSSTFVAIQGTVKQVKVAGNDSAMVVSAFCAPGSSGGPVVDIYGQLVGLQWGGTQYSNHNECHAIPSAALIPYL